MDLDKLNQQLIQANTRWAALRRAGDQTGADQAWQAAELLALQIDCAEHAHRLAEAQAAHHA